MKFLQIAAAYKAAALVIFTAVSAQAATRIDSATFGALEARPIGPAVMSGRIAALDGVASNPKILYVGAANGGLWKTINGGSSFKPIFDRDTQSIGTIAVDQAKPDNVWIGTGEVWVRNSVSIGTGVYRSKDGGDNWTFAGLPKSERIARIVLDPRDPDTVYAAVLGALWNASEERGVYKTTDGGKTWQKILYVNADTGAADLVIDPQEPDTLYAAMWDHRRQPWTFRSGGPGSGLHRSEDAGKTWKKVTAGLPEGELGRIALAVPATRPGTVYANVEAKKGGFYRSDDQGKTWTLQSTAGQLGNRPFYFSAIVADPKDYKTVYKMGGMTSATRDGGKTWSFNLGMGTHADHHALWIDPASQTLYLGTDGGLYRSNDNAGNWMFHRNLPLSQFYHVAVDNARPYNVYGGLQDNGSWAGPSAGLDGNVNGKDWLNVGYGDGFHVWPHPTDRDVVYSQWQGGRMLRYTRSTGEVKAISPARKTGEATYRFNWNAGVEQSSADPNTIYVGAQFLFRSRDRGESWERISPDLTTNNPEKQRQEESGGVTIDNTTAENHCSIISIAESVKDPRVIWVGTDDGVLQVTRDGGKSWQKLSVEGLPANTWVSSIEASRFVAGRAYATFDGHQTGDMKTYVYRTDDFGATWKLIVNEDVTGFAHIVREDRVRQDLLFVGTELGLFLSIDGGKQWARFTGGLPQVAVRDLAIHPRDHDLVIATHGRGIYIVDDITPLRKLTEEVMEAPLTVLQGGPTPIRFLSMVQDFSGVDEFTGRGPQNAAMITYYLKERYTSGDLNIEVFDADNKSIAKLQAGRRRGINRVAWPMRLKAPRMPRTDGMAGGFSMGPLLPEGTYTAKITKGQEVYPVRLELVGDPRLPHTAEERKLQSQTVMRVYGQIERLAFLEAQVTDLRKQSKEKDFNEKLGKLREEWVAGEAGQIRLREELSELYGEVSRFGGRPTKSQLDRAATMEQRVDKASADLEAQLKTGMPTGLKRLTQEAFDKRDR